MREIKFRFWDKVNKRFWFGGQEGESEGAETFQSYFKNGCFLGVMCEPVSYGFKDVDDYHDRELIISQNTGLKDKNGKEIYEGDVVSMFQGSELSQVYFNAGMFLVNKAYRTSVYDNELEVRDEILFNVLDTCKVIGNIYEDPNLLEVKL